MSFSGAIFVLICAACWVAVVLARSGGLRSKGPAEEPQGRRILRAALEKRGDVPDVRNVQSVREVRTVRGIKGLRGGRTRRG